MTAAANRDRRQKPLNFVSPDAEKYQPCSISLVIPTYNERENIVRVIQRCNAVLEQYDFEIIVVDDDSPDKTWQVARQLFDDDDDVRVIRRRDAAGLATAVSRGFRESKKDACAVIDADLQHPPEKVLTLFERLRDGADVAIGSRYHQNGDIRDWPLYRKLVSKGATSVARMAVPAARPLSDPVSGFFAVRRELLEPVSLDPRGYKILLEVLVRCDCDQIAEIPYVFADREEGDSNLTVLEYTQFLEHVLGLGVVDRGWDDIVEPDRAVRMAEFGIVGAIGAGVNTVVFLATYSVASGQYLIAGILAFLVAVNWNFLGNWLLTFDRPEGSVIQQYVTFHVVSLVGFAVYLITLSFAIDILELPALLGNILAILTAATMNFLGAENVVFDTFQIEGVFRSQLAGPSEESRDIPFDSDSASVGEDEGVFSVVGDSRSNTDKEAQSEE